MENFLTLYGEAAKTAIGFFWKAGWAFVLGYWVSAMIQTFVPKGKLTPFMGGGGFKSISIATVFGAASSSCSFAALATARSLILKGAGFIAGVAFMFASTNLVIELGILILIFLGWQFLVAEIIGGVLLIIISSLLIKLFYPENLIKEAKEVLSREEDKELSDFDWKKRMTSKEGWYLVGRTFVSEWKMVWQEILIGFTVAGFIAVLVPHNVWEVIFLTNYSGDIPQWIIAIENALVGPLVAAMTFIGSMGNIPLATVLYSNGVFFTGLMAFIYSDLMVPPLVMVNAKYYGRRMALYIAGIMYFSIIMTSLILNYAFSLMDILPHSSRKIEKITQFGVDYTLFLNIFFVIVAGVLVWLSSKSKKKKMMMGGKMTLKRKVAYLCAFVLISGSLFYLLHSYR